MYSSVVGMHTRYLHMGMHSGNRQRGTRVLLDGTGVQLQPAQIAFLIPSTLVLDQYKTVLRVHKIVLNTIVPTVWVHLQLYR